MLRGQATVAPAFGFRRALPRPPLDAFVECLWSVRGVTVYRRSRVLPNGALQLMLNLRPEPHRVLAFGERTVGREHRRAWIAGLQQLPLAIESPLHSELFAIRFRPGAAHGFLGGLAMHALTDDVVEWSDLPGLGLDELHARVALAGGWAARCAAAEAWLRGRLAPRERDARLVARALAALDAAPARPVRATCDALGLSNRHLIALFRRHVGLPPKTLARVRRFHLALGRLAAAPAEPRVGLALELGYADQAHFNHEFRRLAGVAPSEFVARRGEDDESLIVG